MRCSDPSEGLSHSAALPARLHGEPEIAFVRYLYAASASLHHWHGLRAGWAIRISRQGDRQTAFVRCCSGCLKSGTCSLRTASTSSATSRARRPCFTRCSPHNERRSLAGSRQLASVAPALLVVPRSTAQWDRPRWDERAPEPLINDYMLQHRRAPCSAVQQAAAQPRPLSGAPTKCAEPVLVEEQSGCCCFGAGKRSRDVTQPLLLDN